MKKFELKEASSAEFDTPVVLTDADKQVVPFRFLEVYREMGWKNYRKAEFKAATRNFNIAVGMDSEDRRTIIGRGFSRSKNTLMEGALQDAEAVLANNPYDKEAIYLQALSKYELGQFEQGLMAYWKGMNKRGKRPMFVNGRYQAEGTIEDCVGRHAGPALSKLAPVVRLMERQRWRDLRTEELQTKCVDEVDMKPSRSETNVKLNKYARHMDKLDSVMAHRYLGKLNLEKKWLKKTLRNPNVSTANTKTSEKLYDLAERALTDVMNRQEILRSRKPFYHYQFLTENCKNRLKKDKAKSDEEKQKVFVKNAERLLKDLKVKRAERKTKRCIELADRLKMLLDAAPEGVLRHVQPLRTDFLNTIGLVYLDTKKSKSFLSGSENYKRLHFLMGFDRSYNDLRQEPLVQETAFPYWNYKTWTEKYEGYLMYTDDPVERAWIYHEIGRCHGEMRRFQHMAQSGRKTYREAKKAGNRVWIMNGLLMVVAGEMNFHNKVEAMEALDECLDHAHKFKDESFLEYLLMCRKVIHEKDFLDVLEDTNAVIHKRENLMLHLMHDPELKERAKNLFSRMRVMTTKRRMSVAPGTVPSDSHLTNPKSLSIIPGGTGGRLGFHPVGEETLDDFLDITPQDITHSYY